MEARSDPAELYVELLGTPRASRAGEVLPPLRSRLTWGVLASLILEPQVGERDALARRFWPGFDRSLARKSLREALGSIRKSLGEDCLTADEDAVRLAPGVRCDVHEIRRQVRQAQRAETVADEIAALREAAQRLRGPLLDGCRSAEAYGWIEQTRAQIHREAVEVFHALLSAQGRAGDDEGQEETALRLLAWEPDDAAAQRVVLERAVRSAPRTVSFDTLLGRRVQALPATLQRRFGRLCAIPAPFSAELAQAVAGTEPGDLEGLVEAELVHADGGRFHLRDAVREWCLRRLTGEERRRLTERHARHFVAWVCEAVDLAELEDARLTPTQPAILDALVRETAHLEAVVRWMRSQPFTEEYVPFVILLFEAARTLRGIHWHEPGTPLLQTLLNARELWEPLLEWPGGPFQEIARRLQYAQAEESKRFADALAVGRHFVPTDRPLTGTLADVQAIINALDNAHHACDQAAFEEMLALVRTIPREGIRDESWDRVVFIVAENRLALGRFDEARAANDEALEIRRRLMPKGLPEVLRQRGQILMRQGDAAGARLCWNEALEGFVAADVPHGMGDCLQDLATLHLAEKAYGEAKYLLQQAISLYERAGDPAAVAAAQGPLGDVFLARGDRDAARRHYGAGLAFWQAKEHPRWTALFEKRLAKLRGG